MSGRRTWLLLFLFAAVALAACSEDDTPERVTPETRDPAVAAAHDAVDSWIEGYAGGILVNEDADIYLNPNRKACVRDGMLDTFDQPTLDAIAAAPNTIDLDPAVQEDLADVLGACHEPDDLFYPFLVEQRFSATGAACIAAEVSVNVGWTDFLALAPQVATGQVAPDEMAASYRQQILDGWTNCSGTPQTSLPF